ncbi:TonB-dependent receptor [Stenotrophomonas sp. 24(2023)]|uniref:TonB-dependent siderophore receptor n=1 Tax=Stenotrophomonas sp. 24(2023) TaxID=3068324 RepID=UPI0027E16AFF|nr:TonB-dependent receptor [Stenotrophomonas sp. 24(2023)]WMJ68196.1 TonB-dependent siderophore receptor [Stenotrophomonas sp. 24(2023)]
MPRWSPRPSLPRALAPAPLVLMVRCALVAMAGIPAVQAAGAPAPQAMAADSTRRSYDIGAGPLDLALGDFAARAGVSITMPPALLQGRTSSGLKGQYSVQEGFAQLLAGSGLAVVGGRGGSYVLQAAPAASKAAGNEAMTLATIQVMARRAADGTTEDARSYTSRVTSIASKSDQSFREIPQSVSVITRQQLDDHGSVDIRDALAITPGITSSQLNFDSNYFYSRGFQIDSMQVDGGAPLNIASYTYNVNQNMDFYDRVEVMRGASGLLGGVGDPGGIINVVRKKPLPTARFIIEQQVGSWNHSKTMLDATGPLGLDGRIRGRAVLSYLDTDYFVDIRHQRAPQGYAVLEADLTPRTLLTVGASRAIVDSRGVGGGDVPRYSDGSDIGLPRHTSLTQPWSTAQSRTTELFGALAHEFDNHWKLKLNVMRSTSDYNGTTAFGYGALDKATGKGVAWYGGGHYLYENEQTLADASLSGAFTVAGRTHEFLLGVDRQEIESLWNVGYSPTPTGVQDIDLAHPGAWNPAPANPPSRRYNPWGQTQKGAYGVLRLHPADRLHVILGARVSRYAFNQVYESLAGNGNWTLTSGSRFREPSRTTPYGGVMYDLNDQWTAYLSYASILKPQALSKAGPPPGTSLDPVEGKSYEAGLKGELWEGRANATFSVFNVARTGSAVVDPRYPTSRQEWSGNCCYLPQGKVTSRGFDAELSGEVLPRLQLAAGYTFTRTRDESTRTLFSTITPRHLFKLSTSYTLDGALSRWKVGGSVNVQSRQYVTDTLYDADWNALGTYNFSQPGHAVWNAMAQYQISPRWTATVNVDNLFDKVYYQTVGYATGGNFYGTPRSYLLTLRTQF